MPTLSLHNRLARDSRLLTEAVLSLFPRPVGARQQDRNKAGSECTKVLHTRHYFWCDSLTNSWLKISLYILSAKRQVSSLLLSPEASVDPIPPHKEGLSSSAALCRPIFFLKGEGATAGPY